MPQPDHLIKLDLPDQPLEERLQKYLQICKDKLGLIPNVIQAVVKHPARGSNFINMYNELMLGESGLSKLEREMISVVVSSANRCYYCLVAHGQAVREMSGDPELGEMLVMNYRAADLDPRQRAMLDYAWKLTLTPVDIGDGDRDGLREAGFSDADIYDITETVAFFNYTNRMAHGTDMMPNREYHSMSR